MVIWCYWFEFEIPAVNVFTFEPMPDQGIQYLWCSLGPIPTFNMVLREVCNH